MIELAGLNAPLITNDALYSILKIIGSYPFPIPQEARKIYNQKSRFFEITSLTDKALLKVLAPKIRSRIHTVLIDNDTTDKLGICISQSENIGFTLVNPKLYLTNSVLKHLFYDLIKSQSFWYHGMCHLFSLDLYHRNLTYEERTSKTMLAWLQYFSKEEVEKRGGFAAFESNPYLQTERIHDGLFVQVGDDSTLFDTPEGEALLINAINALPLIK
jgi:hypothetical protein